MLLTGVVAICGACASDQHSRTHEFAVRIDTLAVIGSAVGSGPQAFGRVRDVAFGEAGRLYVLDDVRRELVVFDTVGGHIFTAGRRGEGPGEFGQPLAVAGLAGGGAAVYDLSRNAIHLFDVGGAFRHQLRVPRELGLHAPSFAPFGPDELVFLGGESLFGEPDSLTIHTIPLIEDGAPMVVTRIANPQHVPRVSRVERTAEGGFQMTRQLTASFYPSAEIAPLSGERLAIAAGHEYRVTIVDRPGGLLAVRSRPIAPWRVTEEHRDEERERRGALMREASNASGGSFGPAAMNEEAISRAVDDLLFPDTVPVVQGLRSFPDGTLFVLRAEEGTARADLIDVFGPDGEYRGTIRGIEIPAAVGPRGLVAWVRPDELGVQRVVVARLFLEGEGRN